MRQYLLITAFGLMASSALAASDHADLFAGVSVGMSAADLPKDGYKNFTCVAPQAKTISGFAEWQACAPDDKGLHELHAAADEPGTEDTLIAGHPVDLTLGFNETGRLAEIVIETKRKGPMYLRKKGFLLGLQAKARYGGEGWDCQETPLSADEEPLGPSSVKERCAKTAGDRRITLDRALFRKVGAAEKDFTSQSRVVIDWVGK